MPYDETLARRVREHFSGRGDVVEKKMFGGLAFLLRGHMCCGVVDEQLMARVGPDQYVAALARPHARAMDFTGRPMKGFVYVAPEGFRHEADLRAWLSLCESFVSMIPSK
jgi:TfoX/Sxy family transcriptional regulator of competence genes